MSLFPSLKLQNQATAALTPPYEELARQLPTEPALGIDEDGKRDITDNRFSAVYLGHVR